MNNFQRRHVPDSYHFLSFYMLQRKIETILRFGMLLHYLQKYLTFHMSVHAYMVYRCEDKLLAHKSLK